MIAAQDTSLFEGCFRLSWRKSRSSSPWDSWRAGDCWEATTLFIGVFYFRKLFSSTFSSRLWAMEPRKCYGNYAAQLVKSNTRRIHFSLALPILTYFHCCSCTRGKLNEVFFAESTLALWGVILKKLLLRLIYSLFFIYLIWFDFFEIILIHS